MKDFHIAFTMPLQYEPLNWVSQTESKIYTFAKIIAISYLSYERVCNATDNSKFSIKEVNRVIQIIYNSALNIWAVIKWLVKDIVKLYFVEFRWNVISLNCLGK